MKTYELLDIGGKAAIKCLRCNRTSFNLNDVRERYCGHCHLFHQPFINRLDEAEWENWKGNSDGTVGVD